MMPEVSVIIPVYKSVNVLETAVNSVLAQSFGDFEILLIDDGSPDESPALCRSLQERDARIRVYHKENGGICSARNYGLAHAGGTYVAFLDHDDEYMPGYLEDNVALLKKYQADVVKFERLREQHNLDGTIQTLAGDRIKNMPGIRDGVLCYRGREIAEHYPEIRDAVKTMYIWDGMYSRAFLQSHGIRFDESFKFGHEDIMFNLEVLAAAETMVFQEKVYYRHKYRESTSTSASFHETRISDAVKTARRESSLLEQWHYPEEQILWGYMNEAYRVLNILSLPSADCPRSSKKKLIAKFWNETAGTLGDARAAVGKLLRRNPPHGALAWMLYHRLYGLSLEVFRVYKSREYRKPK